MLLKYVRLFIVASTLSLLYFMKKKAAVWKPTKFSSKWIVLATEDDYSIVIERLSLLKDWEVVVVSDRKYSESIEFKNIHVLNSRKIDNLGYSIASKMNKTSSSWKNVGYLYAISKGAEWIYDMEIDIEFYGKGLDQFVYKNTTRGLKFLPKSKLLSDRMFNSHHFFGDQNSLPNGFPDIKYHKNGFAKMISCRELKNAAIQHAMVETHAKGKSLNGNRSNGKKKFNKFAPPITLSRGTFSPFDSQNTLFHRRAFHTLLLPSSFDSEEATIWRSYFAQKILNLTREYVALMPSNTVKLGQTGKETDLGQERPNWNRVIEKIDKWNCYLSSVEACILHLTDVMISSNMIKEKDGLLTRAWIQDLAKIGANQKLKANADLSKWCSVANYTKLSENLPEAQKIAENHQNSFVQNMNLDTVLIVTNNFPFAKEVGLIQRLYGPYFGMIIFCGTFDERNINPPDQYLDRFGNVNFVNLSESEVQEGFFIYICAQKIRELQLQNVRGYYMMSDDVVFNHWQSINYQSVVHTVGAYAQDPENRWWAEEFKNISSDALASTAEFMTTSEHPEVVQTWNTFNDGVKRKGFKDGSEALYTQYVGSISDFMYIPTSMLNYFGDLMEVFFENYLFLEIAVDKFLRSVDYETPPVTRLSYLWAEDRDIWPNFYNSSFLSFHPMKYGYSRFNLTERYRYCEHVLQLMIYKYVRLFGIVATCSLVLLIKMKSAVNRPIEYSSKWIVLATEDEYSEAIEKLLLLKDWEIVLVSELANTIHKTSSSRKNVGYLYAISKGAEWIYDMDIDIEFHGKGLDQFSFDKSTRGLKFSPESDNHTNGFAQMESCREMKNSVIQHGLVRDFSEVEIPLFFFWCIKECSGQFSGSPQPQSKMTSPVRRANIDLVQVVENEDLFRANQKLKANADLSKWCSVANYTKLDENLPKAEKIAENHQNSSNLETVLIITKNYPFAEEIGLVQRLYGPYFGMIIFCGTFDEKKINPPGYYMMSDDVQFNHWQPINHQHVVHTIGTVNPRPGEFWFSFEHKNISYESLENIVDFMNETDDPEVVNTWKMFEQGVRNKGLEDARQVLLARDSWSISDFMYIPTSMMNYFGDLMEIFFEHNLFLEIAVEKFLRSVEHDTPTLTHSSYLWCNDRIEWPKFYNSSFLSFHPIKYGAFRFNLTERYRYCEHVLQLSVDILLKGQKLND
ncbi:unnamed protein product [Caenorhabditis auriculariae]|uniref:Uncharacterized protein n=1 Tax=Caenorhabditis auriculariae TaxID=2777116 RepID=A0A8S1HPP1_9PELO|nr:unnamed protein product [Caenorhabditis auriculariae]